MNKGLCRITAFSVMACVILSGCAGNRAEIKDDKKDIAGYDRGITVSNNVTPDEGSVLTCIAGYEKNGSKIAFIRDMEGTAGFEVIDVDKDKAVFEGKVKYKKDTGKEDGEVGVCDLSDVDRNGSYYIRIDNGRVSDVFKIEEDIYKRILSDRLSSVGEEEDINKDTGDDMKACYLRITDHLLAQEFFPDSISPAVNGEARIIPRTMLPARVEINELRELIKEDGSFKTPLSQDIGGQYQYSAVFALFAYEYREYEKGYAGECADIAEKAFQNAEDGYADCSDPDKKNYDDKRFWASSQLYKLTGKAAYREIAESYASDIPTGWNEDKCGYLGTLAYLTCYNRIDLDVSEQFITALMDEINTVVRDSFKEDYLVAEGICNDETDQDTPETENDGKDDEEISDTAVKEVFENARLAVLGNYISKNIKYVECAENHLAYLYGRNMLGKDYAYSEDAKYYGEPQMFILAGLIDSYIYEDKQPEAMER